MVEENVEIVDELSKTKDAEFNKSTEILVNDILPKQNKPKNRFSKIEIIFTVVVIIHILAITAIVATLIFLVINERNKTQINTGGSDVQLNNTIISTTTPTTMSQPVNCFGYTISKCNLECGLNFLYSSRIIGGVEATPNSWPSTVYLKIFYNYVIRQTTFTVEFVCSGTLIDEYTILTVAHCVQPKTTLKVGLVSLSANLDYVEVLFGVHNINDNFIYSIRSSRITTHENFDPIYMLNDIALIKLSRKVTLSSRVQIACLPTNTINIQSNTDSIAVGWGIRTLSSTAASDTLQQANLTIYDSSLCSQAALNSGGVYSTQLCAGDMTGNRDTCKGDGGGPLFIKQTYNNVTKLVVAGLTSYGKGCADPNLPGLYTRTSSYINWILKNI